MLKVPPAGEPDKEIAVPVHPLTLVAVTVGSAFTMIVIVAVSVQLIAVTVPETV